jgi:5'-3' exonuclease
MGVPKFFRWLSERYPKINQPFTSPPSPATVAAHFSDDSDLPPSVKSACSRNIERSKGAGGGDEHGSDASFSSSAPRASDAVEADLEHEHHLKCNLRPEFDRLYIDMNGIIHCCSHNNATDDDPSIDPEMHLDAVERSASSPPTPPPGSVPITEEQIFKNVCYYFDRIVTDVAQPQELVYLAIDGVAPRAKMNQQRSRRYRSGKEREIEATFFEAHLASAVESSAASAASEIVFRGFDGDGHDDEEEEEENGGVSYADRMGTHTPGISEEAAKDGEALVGRHDNIREVTPGRFSGTFQTSEDGVHTDDALESKSGKEIDDLDAGKSVNANVLVGTPFHSNTITPGTPFFDRCTAHIKDFVRRKLREDPRWANLTIIFSGPDVPGEGEHKIMDFIRRERARSDYNPNTRHCLFGQDGDLIMLGLATHEPNFCLLREEVIFEEGRKVAALAKHRRSSTEEDGSNGGSSASLSASLDAYMHNSNFELLHMSLLRDYLAYEFETNDVVPSSPFDIESTIDDFVFMTFFVGNDFLPHMPALDIGDEAFDLLFYTYKRHRYDWLASEMQKSSKVQQDKSTPYPYLTHGGNIVSGSRLEEFLSEVGSHEDPYYSNKNRKKEKELKRIRKFDKKARRKPSIPSDEALWNREEKDRERYMEMLQSIDANIDDDDEDDAFSPVISSGQLPTSSPETGDKDGIFHPEENELQVGFLDNMSRLLKNSLSPQGIAEVGGSVSSKAAAAATQSQQKDHAPASAAALECQLTDLKGRCKY